MKPYSKRMTIDDRKIIERMYRDGASVNEIAAALGRDASGIYRELDRGATGKLDKNGNAGYSARLGEDVAIAGRSSKGRPRAATRSIMESNS